MASKLQTHEDLHRQHTVKTGSNRSFGITFFVVLSILGLVPLLSSGEPRIGFIAVGSLFLIAGIFYPKVLERPNQWWAKFGLLLNRLVAPLVLGFLFYIVLTPMGLAMRLLGKDLLSLRFDHEAASYWIKRDDGPAPDTMKNQF